MQTRTDQHTGDAVSLLGYGGMRFPVLSGRQSAIDEDAALSLIDRALDGGINLFDTAWFYHGGRSETFLRKALGRHPRQSYYLADKMPIWELGSDRDAERIFEQQLSKCGVDYFDYYLCQFLTDGIYHTMLRRRVHPFLLEMKAQGKIRRLGFSFHDTPELLKTIVESHEWDFALLQLNYFDWDTQRAEQQYQIAVDAGLQVMVMEPLRGGTLASLTPEAEAILRGADPHASVASWGLRFAASLPGVLSVLSGMTTREQLEDNLRTFQHFRPLSDEDRAVLDRALAAHRKAGAVPCTGCKYCIDCPAGVNIPAVFATYNQYKKDGARFLFQRHYGLIGEERQAHNCTACGRCLSHCPQHIDIPARLREVAGQGSRSSRV